MANNLRIFKREVENNTTEARIKIFRHYVCDEHSHFVHNSLEVIDPAGKSILTHWCASLQLGVCDQTCGSLNLGYIPDNAQMRFASISLLDPTYTKQNTHGD